MGKQGPCYHCGVTSTPLWRNGPPEKPVLCNACGSRWRTKGTLANYTPLHARSDADDYEDQRVSKLKAVFLRKKDEKIKKRKLYYESNVGARFATDDCHGFQKSIDEDTSYRSSSGSVISNSESSAHLGSGDASDLTGPAQSITWETQVPSRKRTCMTRPKQSSVEKLTKDLCTILHEQQSSYLSGSSEEDLLFETGTPLVSVEIGHGSVLMKHPSSLMREEESEASSLSVETKQCAITEAYSHSTPMSEHNDYNGEHIHYHVSEKPKKIGGQMIRQELVRDKSNNARMQQLWRHDSPLRSIDLNDVVNFEVLVGHLTREEQQQLLKYLPSSDSYTDPDSLMGIFESSGFKDDLSSFQQLVSEGILSNAFSGVNAEDFKTLKKLVLSNLTKSKWLELYKILKDDIPSCTNGEHRSIAISGCKSNLVETKRNPKKPCDIEGSEMSASEVKPAIRSPLRKTVITNAHQETKDSSEIDRGSFFNSQSLLMPTNGGRLLMLDSYQFADESSDQDILLDVPSNGSFPEAEFLLPTSS